MNDSPKNQRLQGDSHEPKLPIFIGAVLDDYGLSLSEFRIYGHVARRAGAGVCFESVPHIAKHCKVGTGTVKRALKSLCDEYGLLVRESHPGRTSSYRLTYPDHWKPGPNQTQVSNDPPPGSPQTHRQVSNDPPPGSPQTHEGTPTKEPLQGTPTNNSGSGDGHSSVQDALSSNLTTAVQSEPAHGNEARDPGEDKNSAAPPALLQRVTSLGINLDDPGVKKTLDEHGDRLPDLIATIESYFKRKSVDSPNRTFINALNKPWTPETPEKPRQTQPSVLPKPDESEPPPPFGTPAYWDWQEKRKQSA